MVHGNDIGLVSNILFSNINLAVMGDNPSTQSLKLFLMIQEMDDVIKLKKAHNVRLSNATLEIEHSSAWKCKVAQRECIGVMADI